MKKALGGGAYTLMGIVKAFDLQPYTGRLLVPGKEPDEGSMLFMGVGNSRLAGGGFEIAPLAKLDDGLLDLAVIKAGTAGEMMHLGEELEDPMNPSNKVLQRQPTTHLGEPKAAVGRRRCKSWPYLAWPPP